MEAFEVIKSSNMSKDRSRAIVQSCFTELVVTTEATPVSFAAGIEDNLPRDEERGLSSERVHELQSQLLFNYFEDGIHALSRTFAARHGGAWDELAEPDRVDVMSGVARALVEQQRLFQLRLGAPKLPFRFPPHPAARSANEFKKDLAGGHESCQNSVVTTASEPQRHPT